MRFKTFCEATAPAWRAKKKKINQSNFLGGYDYNLSATIEYGNILYRGFDEDHVSVVFDGAVSIDTGDFNVKVAKVKGRTEPRSSLTGDSTLLSLTTLWKDFPNRQYSTFVSHSGDHLDDFGDYVGIVIPSDNVEKFGYMPADFNESRTNTSLQQMKDRVSKTIMKFAAFAQSVNYLMEPRPTDRGKELKIKLMDMIEDFQVEDIFRHGDTSKWNLSLQPNQLEKFTKFMDHVMKNHRELKMLANKDPSSGYAASVIDTMYTFMEMLEENRVESVKEFFELVSPEEYKATAHESLADLPAKPRDEVWFEGDYLLVYSTDDQLNYLNQTTQIKILQALQKENK